MDQNIIAKVMSKVGPVVKTVILRSNGKLDQITIDMTSTKNELAKVLGGELTIIGQLNVLDCVLMKLADETKKGLVRNTHKLPYPFHEEQHLGDILLMRMDEQAEPLSLTKDEWTGFLKTAPYTEDAYAAWKLENNVVDDEEDDEEGDLTPEEQEVFEDVVEKLTKQLKKEPTQDQVLEALVKAGHMAIAEKLSMSGDDDEEDDEDFTEEEQVAIEKCMKTLEKKLKRSPSKAEVIESLTKSGNTDLAAKLTLLAEADSEDSEDDDEEPQLKQLQGEEQEDTELSEADQKTLDKMCETLAKKLKRDPTKDEVVEALVKAGKGELAELVDQMSDGSSDDDDDDDDDEESEDGEAIFANLQKALGRDPTEEEMKQALSDTGLTSNFTEEETLFMSDFIDGLEAKLQRMATEEEVFEALKEAGKDELLAKLMEEAERDDEDMELTEEDEEYIAALIAKLSKKLKRMPSEEDIMQALASSGDEQATSILEKMMNNDDDDDMDEDDDDDDEEEEEVKPAPKKQQQQQKKQPQQQQKKQPQQQQQKKPQQQQQKKPQQQQGNPNKGKQQQRGPPQGRSQPQNKKARRG